MMFAVSSANLPKRHLDGLIRADWGMRRFSRWCLAKTSPKWFQWLNSPKVFSSHGGALCPSRQVQVRHFSQGLHSAGDAFSGPRDIQEKIKWQRPSNYRQQLSHFLAWQPATLAACQTLNAPGSALRSVVPSAKLSTTVSASRGLRLAQLAAHWPTTWASKLHTRTSTFRGHQNSQARRLLRAIGAVFWRLDDIRAVSSAQKGTA